MPCVLHPFIIVFHCNFNFFRCAKRRTFHLPAIIAACLYEFDKTEDKIFDLSCSCWLAIPQIAYSTTTTTTTTRKIHFVALNQWDLISCRVGGFYIWKWFCATDNVLEIQLIWPSGQSRICKRAEDWIAHSAYWARWRTVPLSSDQLASRLDAPDVTPS